MIRIGYVALLCTCLPVGHAFAQDDPRPQQNVYGDASEVELAKLLPDPPWLSDVTDAEASESIRKYSTRTDCQGPNGWVGTFDQIVERLNRYEQLTQVVRSSDRPRTLTARELTLRVAHLRHFVRAISAEFTYEETTPALRRPITRKHVDSSIAGVKQYTKTWVTDINDQHVTAEHTLVFDGKEHLSLNTDRMEGLRSPDRSPMGTYELWRHLDNLALLVGPDLREVQSAATDKLEFFGVDERHVSVKETLDIVDGVECHVLRSPLGFCAWLQVDGGFCYLRRFVLFTMTEDDEALTLESVVENRDFRKLECGLQWPFSSSECQFEEDESSGKHAPHWTRTRTTRVKTVEVNDLNDEMFTLHFPPGTKVFDMIRKVYYFVPHDGKLLESMIQDGAAILDVNMIPDKKRIDIQQIKARESLGKQPTDR